MSSSNFKIGNDLFISNNITANENCNSLFITINKNDNESPHIIEIEMTKAGEIMKVRLTNKNENHESSIFSPKSYIHISSFFYDSLYRNLTFSLEGTLFKPYTTRSIDIKANVNEIIVKPTSYNSLLSSLRGSLISLSGDKEAFFSAIIINEKNQSSLYKYFYSDSGFRISFQLDESFINLPKGSYPLNSFSHLLGSGLIAFIVKEKLFDK